MRSAVESGEIADALCQLSVNIQHSQLLQTVMSWKGISKAVKRAPHLVTAKVGSASTTKDEDFRDMDRKVQDLQELFEKLHQDAREFRDATSGRLQCRVVK